MSTISKYVPPSVIGASKVQNEIILLESQISSINEQIAALQEQTANLKTNIVTPTYEGDLKSFTKEVKSASQTIATHQPQIEMLEQAIANLQSQLPAKNAALAELQKQEVRQARLKRLDEGRVLLREKISQIEELAQTLADTYLELKRIQMEHDVDFKAIYPPSLGSQVLGRHSLVNFHGLMIPKLFEEVGLFIATSIPFDVFAQERKVQQQAEAKKWATQIANAETATQQHRRERAKLTLETRRANLENLIRMKQEELEAVKQKRAQWLDFGGTNTADRFDAAIHSVQVEINSIQTELDALLEG